MRNKCSNLLAFSSNFCEEFRIFARKEILRKQVQMIRNSAQKNRIKNSAIKISVQKNSVKQKICAKLEYNSNINVSGSNKDVFNLQFVQRKEVDETKKVTMNWRKNRGFTPSWFYPAGGVIDCCPPPPTAYGKKYTVSLFPAEYIYNLMLTKIQKNIGKIDRVVDCVHHVNKSKHFKQRSNFWGEFYGIVKF